MTPLSAHELDDLQHAILEQMSDKLLPTLAKANRTGELVELLRLLGMSNLVSEDGYADVQPKKIAVLGRSMVKEKKLKSIAQRHGIMSDDLECTLGYEELKHYDFAKLRNSFTYRAVLVGPMPHSTSGKGSSSSAIAEMEAHPEKYPPVIRMHDSNGLKITNNSFAQALDELESSY